MLILYSIKINMQQKAPRFIAGLLKLLELQIVKAYISLSLNNLTNFSSIYSK